MADYERRPSHHEIPYGRDRTMDENAMRRSVTRASYQSHAPSAAPSATSWVNSSHGHRPLPQPRESVTSSTLSARIRQSRPLPQPQYYAPMQYSGFREELHDEEVDYVQVPSNQGDSPYGFQNKNEGAANGGIMVAGPSDSPMLLEPGQSSKSRGFVGGFFKGLKRLPKMLKGGGEKRQISRKATFGTGTDGTSPTVTPAAITRGNTLPRYLSNPSLGPSNPQFAHRLSMAPNAPGQQQSALQLRTNQDGPQFPMVTLSPPSDEIGEGEQADYYEGQGMGPAGGGGEFQPAQDNVLEYAPSLRATVMVYGSDSHSQAPTIMPPMVVASPPARRPSTSGPRVSYATAPPPREVAQVQTDPLPEPTPGPSNSPPPLRPTAGPSHQHQANNSHYLSLPPTSPYTMSMAQSFYDPSFASHLSPVEKFFKGLYHLPWVAPERVTVDYRPADSARAKGKMKALGKVKVMPSWYRTVMARSRRASRNLDLLSSGGGSATESLGNSLSPLGSPGSMSRQSRRSGRSSNQVHQASRARPQRRKNRVTSNTTDDSQPIPPQRTSPVIPAAYPYPYPYPYPYNYPPYGGYPAVPPQPQPMPQMQMATRAPRTRSHRRHKTPKYAPGYPVYQPMTMPPPHMNMNMNMNMGMPPQGMPMNMAPQPMAMTMGAPGQQQQQMVGIGPGGAPVYFISPSPPQSSDGDQNQAGELRHIQGQISPVIMHLVPGAFNPGQGQSQSQNSAMISPPLTPQRQKAGNTYPAS